MEPWSLSLAWESLSALHGRSGVSWLQVRLAESAGKLYCSALVHCGWHNLCFCREVASMRTRYLEVVNYANAIQNINIWGVVDSWKYEGKFSVFKRTRNFEKCTWAKGASIVKMIISAFYWALMLFFSGTNYVLAIFNMCLHILLACCARGGGFAI